MRLILLSIPCLLACIDVYAQSPERFDCFRGHFSIGETVFVSIGSTGSKMEWVQVGTLNRGNHVISLDAASSTLILKDQAGEAYTLPLTKLASDHQLDPEKKEDPALVAPKAGPAMRLPTLAPTARPKANHSIGSISTQG
ncbi:MAG: hypothetical protein H3C27_12010 [Opitutaceae bacterium]|nr:hypothetical protein [Opitutaceae bacterium]